MFNTSLPSRYIMSNRMAKVHAVKNYLPPFCIHICIETTVLSLSFSRIDAGCTDMDRESQINALHIFLSPSFNHTHFLTVYLASRESFVFLWKNG